MQADHKIEMHEIADDDERLYWECSCGHAGTALAYRAEQRAEKHIPEGETWLYRSRA
jgi:hypothetical protein